ncbi:MAG: energy-coupling factor transporter transmembrane protein EcfT [candidate division KSB1 bacterium]|nr:energy-coupling factor transporter transmembrane protein EcfT [candidate division KSB1 bacterium]
MTFLNDITLGQYYPADSFVHRLDPRTKLLTCLMGMTCLLLSHNLVFLFSWGILIWVGVKIARLPLALALKNLRPFIWLFTLTFFIHLLFTTGRTIAEVPLVHAQITYEGLMNGLSYTFRLALLIVLAALLTLTTSPIELTDALEKLLSPAKRLGLPVHELVMMMTLALRFIPTLIAEAERIQKAQMSRGATFEGNLIQRVKSIIPLILPLFISAFRRADELALAMDARCYRGGEGRTSFKELKFHRSDYLFLAGATVALGIMIVI